MVLRVTAGAAKVGHALSSGTGLLVDFRGLVRSSSQHRPGQGLLPNMGK
jgi:hypothetical protein